MRMRKSERPVLLVVIAVIVAAAFVGCGGEESVEVSTTGDGFIQIEVIGMNLRWKVNGTDLEVIVSGPTDGWVAVGFDPESIMKGANFIIGYMDNGTAHVEDHFGNKTIEHNEDTTLGGSENVTLIEGSEDAQGTTMHFTIPLDSGDEYDKALVPGQEYKIMLAYGGSDDFVTEHAKEARVAVTVEL